MRSAEPSTRLYLEMHDEISRQKLQFIARQIYLSVA